MLSLFREIRIGNVVIPGNIFLAPMAGFTDRAYREICARNGALLCFTEMVSCEGLSYRSGKTVALLDRAPSEHLYGIQLFTASPEKAGKAAVFASAFNPTLIDLNCGCPVPKVVKNGAGSALMRDPQKIGRIVEALTAGCRDAGADIPISVKLRSGWTADEITYLEAAVSAVQAGAAMVCLHPRTRSQGYGGTADWDHITRLAGSIDVPVLGSGDLYTPEDARRMLAQTGCAGIIFARGAVGNPFVFERTRRFLTEGTDPGTPSPSIRASTALEHLDVLTEMKGESVAVREIRKHMCSYTKGLPGSARLRNAIVRAESLAEYRDLLSPYLRQS